MAKTLIAFFSRRGENWVDGSVRFLPKGNNEVIVEKIKAQLPEADVFQIDTVKKYSDDYMVCIEEAKQELRAKARPELTARVENMDQYDTIILGYPNWWGVPPMAVPDAELTAGVAIHGAAASHCDREVNLILAQAR